MAKSKSQTIQQLLITAFSMLVIPVSLFFVGRWYLFAGIDNTDVYSCVLSILSVHVILGVYCYVAYQEVRQEEQVAAVAQLKKAD